MELETDPKKLSEAIGGWKTMTVELTVGIPTWNGESTIKTTIRSVLRCIPDNARDRVEIIVSDNASTDGTAAMVKPCVSKSAPTVTYHVNQTNLGFDRNVDKVMRLARGKFVWLLSDDDELAPGAIEKVISVVSKYPQVAAVFVNFHHIVSIRTDKDRLCRNGEEFFHVSHFKSGLVSSNIFSTEVWCGQNLSRYFGSRWIHLAYLVEALSTRPAYVIAHQYLIQGNRWRWVEGGEFLSTGLKLVRVFRNMERLNYSGKLRREADMTIKGGYPSNIIRAKLEGVRVDAGLVRQFCELYGRHPSFWLIDLPILLVPNAIYRSMRSFASAVTRRVAAGRHFVHRVRVSLSQID